MSRVQLIPTRTDPCNPRKHKENTRQSNTISPQLVLGRVAVGIFQPCTDLLFGLRLDCAADDFAMSFKHIFPKCQFFICRLVRPEICAPPIGKSLQPCALGWSKPADYVFRRIHGRRVFVVACNERICEILLSFGMIGMSRLFTRFSQLRCLSHSQVSRYISSAPSGTPFFCRAER